MPSLFQLFFCQFFFSAAQPSLLAADERTSMPDLGNLNNAHGTAFPDSSSTSLAHQLSGRSAASPARKVERFVSGLFDKMAMKTGVGGERGECGAALQHEENPCKQPLLVKVRSYGVRIATRLLPCLSSVALVYSIGHTWSRLLFSAKKKLSPFNSK